MNKLGRFGSSAGQKFLWALPGGSCRSGAHPWSCLVCQDRPRAGSGPRDLLEIHLTSGEEVGRGLPCPAKVGRGFLHPAKVGRVCHAQVGTKASPCSRCCSAFEDLASLAGSLAAASFAQHLLSPG